MDDLFDDYMKNRPQRLCKNCGKCGGIFPDSPWAKLPDGCGYEGWFFKVREEIKQKIRKQKEELLLLKVELKYSDSVQNSQKTNQIVENIEQIKKNIESYAKYGSLDW